MKLSDLSPNPRNPRRITDKKLEMLKKSLAEFGDLSGIVFNKTTGNLVGGHQRLKVLPPDAEIDMESHSHGHITINGDRFNFRVVEWDETKEKAANIAANKHGGEWDFTLLNEWLLELDAANVDMDLTGFDASELEERLSPEEISSQNPYTNKIVAPIYEPTGPKPDIGELYTIEKAVDLIKEIDNADIPEAEKTFLKFAAYRHSIFNYQAIAEYYAQSNKTTQRLMEKSALVIIDFKKAIENGFVKMTQDIADAYQDTNELPQ